jgi:hypothetical protein
MTRCKRSNFAILCIAAALCWAPLGFAQNANLSFKPGLWEVQVSLNKGAPRITRACFLVGTTLDNYLMVTNRGISGTTCTVSNKVQKGRGITFDNACTSGTLASTGHFDFQLPDEQNFTGSSHIVVTGTAEDKPVNKTLDREFTAKFVNIECGTVVPFNVAPVKTK